MVVLEPRTGLLPDDGASTPSSSWIVEVKSSIPDRIKFPNQEVAFSDPDVVSVMADVRVRQAPCSPFVAKGGWLLEMEEHCALLTSGRWLLRGVGC
jgi:hypothetical protein